MALASLHAFPQDLTARAAFERPGMQALLACEAG